MTDDEVSAELRLESRLNRARKAFNAARARIEQAEAQLGVVGPIEVRRMEFEAVKEIMVAAGADQTPDALLAAMGTGDWSGAARLFVERAQAAGWRPDPVGAFAAMAQQVAPKGDGNRLGGSSKLAAKLKAARERRKAKTDSNLSLKSIRAEASPLDERSLAKAVASLYGARDCL
jgi:hypothetical protein